jgi:uncharacterized protein YdiU (UPF0061 family)
MSSSTPVIPFDNTYARLPAHFYSRVVPVPVSSPRLLKLNVDLARMLQLDPDAMASEQGVAVLAGNRVAAGSEPLAQAYAGHQFGHFVPQLGDGRANLLGEVVGTDGIRYDIQLKGSGPTPFSRRGDGRAAIGPVLREYLVSEFMHAAEVPSTRALAAVLTGERVVREDMPPGAVLTRVAQSHLRVGTFQYFASRGDATALHLLADYTMARHYPEAANAVKPVRALLDAVIGRHARLVAQWMSLGFIHGVMNTDNTSISGETLDYGPCAFMEQYDPNTVFSSIDHQGRYAYANQPNAAHWNLTRLAEALLPLLLEEEGAEEPALISARAALAGFGPQYEAARLDRFRAKLGLASRRDGDEALVDDLLERMAANEVDFTLFFRTLCDAAEGLLPVTKTRTLFQEPTVFDRWAAIWRNRFAKEALAPEARAASMRLVNPAVIPRNHMVDAALRAAADRGDLQPFNDLLDVVTKPFAGSRPDLPRIDLAIYTQPAGSDQRIEHTFCGT